VLGGGERERERGIRFNIWCSRPENLSIEAIPWEVRVCICGSYQIACDGRPGGW
jgi:hypothetical protein